MSYLQHRNHVADSTYPWPGCRFCQAFIVEPAIRAHHGDYGKPRTGISFVAFPDDDDLAEIAETDELAA